MAGTIIVNGITYHWYPKPSLNHPRRIWYVWWTVSRKRIRRSTGCRLKRDAEQVIAAWDPAPRIKRTFEECVQGFFDENGPFLSWKPRSSRNTIYQHKHNLDEFLLPWYAETIPEKIAAPDLEKRLRQYRKKDGSPLSGSAQQSVINTALIILREFRREQLIPEVPLFHRPQRDSARKSPLSSDDIAKLWPVAREEILRIWGGDPYAPMFSLMCLTALHAGLRPSEIRALHGDQLFPDQGCVLVNRMITVEGKISGILKKRTEDDPGARWSVIPDTTMQALISWAEGSRGPLFMYRDSLVRREYFEARFKLALERAGIDLVGRWITPYSLRYTYRSRVEGWLPDTTIRDTMGHRSEEMSRHYLHAIPEQVRALQLQRPSVEKLWRLTSEK